MALLINQNLPTRRVRCYTSVKAWVADYFRQIVRQQQRDFLYGNYSLYRSLRNKVIGSAKSFRQTYYQELLRSLRNCDPCRWWKHTKPLTGLGKTSSDLHAMANLLCGGGG